MRAAEFTALQGSAPDALTKYIDRARTVLLAGDSGGAEAILRPVLADPRP